MDKTRYLKMSPWRLLREPNVTSPALKLQVVIMNQTKPTALG